jgi:ABC-type multidrug transport system ATPase subunit
LRLTPPRKIALAADSQNPVDGRKYADLPTPLHEVGAMLEARAIHTGRSAYNHLLALAQTHGIGRARVNEVIDLVGIQTVARKRVGGFSLGMASDSASRPPCWAIPAC